MWSEKKTGCIEYPFALQLVETGSFFSVCQKRAREPERTIVCWHRISCTVLYAPSPELLAGTQDRRLRELAQTEVPGPLQSAPKYDDDAGRCSCATARAGTMGGLMRQWQERQSARPTEVTSQLSWSEVVSAGLPAASPEAMAPPAGPPAGPPAFRAEAPPSDASNDKDGPRLRRGLSTG